VAKGYTLKMISQAELRRRLRRPEERAMEQLVMTAEVICKKLVNVSNPRPYTTPSAPGEPPRKRLGNLHNSITFAVTIEGGEVVGYYGVRKGPASDDKGHYAIDLEFGTSRMKARPYLRPTFYNNKPKLGRAWKRGFKK